MPADHATYVYPVAFYTYKISIHSHPDTASWLPCSTHMHHPNHDHELWPIWDEESQIDKKDQRVSRLGGVLLAIQGPTDR